MFVEKVTYDNKSTACITLKGEENSKTVVIGEPIRSVWSPVPSTVTK